jgi:pimeloyl-ACP methyl ester carboxylesterase
LGPRVTALGIACGFAPVDRPGGTRGLPRDLRLGLPLLRRAPWISRLAFASLPRQYARDPRKAFDKQFGRRMPASDHAALAEPGIRENLQQGAVEALRRGVRGFAYELGLLFAQPWGFQPRQIRVPTRLWYGTEDPLVPLHMGEALAREISSARLTLCRDEGHLLLFRRWREILDTVTA